MTHPMPLPPIVRVAPLLAALLPLALLAAAPGCVRRNAGLSEPRRIGTTTVRPGHPGRVMPSPGTQVALGTLPEKPPETTPPVNPPGPVPLVNPDAVPLCPCNATEACDYGCDCDPHCPCPCDGAWGCEDCACDPECFEVYGDCLADGLCNPRCPEDPDCAHTPPTPPSGCACDATASCDYECDCDPQCPCDCDDAWGCEDCACDPECDPAHGDCLGDGVCNARCPADPDCPADWQASETCRCDASDACDYDCPCDRACPCACDRAWGCEGGCDCDPECQAAYGDCTGDGTCNPRCPNDPDCAPNPPGPEPLPPGQDDLEPWRERCVAEINRYRATLGLAPLQRWREGEACVDGQSRDDGIADQPHGTFGRCGERAQNTCPGWRSLEGTVTDCLEAMWNEGPGEPFSEHGHFLNMSSTAYRAVACGFHLLPDGSVWALQDFR